MSVSYGGDSITFADGSTVGSGWAGFKNRVINGDMRIKQRANSSVFVTTDAGNFIDLLSFGCGTSANVSYSQSSDAPAGFSNSASVTVVTADTSLASGDYAYFQYKIEGNNIADFAWGTASATPVTLSFWAKSSLVGTYTAGLLNSGLNRTYMSNFTINAQNTWEYKTITIPGDTTGTWLTDNNIGIRIRIGLAGGSNSIVANNQWVAGNGLATSGTVNWLATVGNTFSFTGLQLEKGSTATSFEYRPFGTELALCQRYFIRVTGRNHGYIRHDGSFNSFFVLPTTMRTDQPSATFNALGTFTNFQSATASSPSSFSVASESKASTRAWIYVNGTLGSYSSHSWIPSWENFSFDLNSEL
jgi:hypothetical protein